MNPEVQEKLDEVSADPREFAVDDPYSDYSTFEHIDLFISKKESPYKDSSIATYNFLKIAMFH